MVNSNIKFRKIFVRFAFGLAVIGAVLLGTNLVSQYSEASSPSSGVLTDTSAPLIYSAGPFTAANATPITMVDTGPRCNANTFPCDNYNFDVTLPVGYRALNPNASIKVTLSWADTGSGMSDYDLYLYKGTVATTNGAMPADAKSASGANPEIANFTPVTDGTQKFTIKIVPYTPTGETLRVKVELLAGAPPVSGGGGGVAGCTINCNNFGAEDPTVPGNPRYQNFYAPNGSKGQSGSGEFNIGYNALTKRIMVMNTGPILRLTPPEAQSPAKPECCEALWEDKSSTVTDTGLDPILWTDSGYFGANGYIRKSGRTFASNATAGANALYAYTDNDGDSYIPLGLAPPGGADHQTIGSGPFPATLSALGNAINGGNYVLYCSQDLVGALCQRSIDLGASYGPSVPATGPGTSNSQGCSGLHGHVHIATDGTAWLPDKSCGSKQGGGFSLNAGVTPFTEFSVSKTVADADGPAFTTVPQADGADPSIALDASNTAYFCYVNNEAGGAEGHAHIAVGKRIVDTLGVSTIRWLRDTDVGITHGIVNAAHPEAVGGSTGRAACGFMGTNVRGDYQPDNFPGKWYVFIATTYDEGVNWVTVNATPNDPVQNMSGIWQQGGSATDRNLLDFNEVTVDEKGRVLYGYSDGCTSGPCIGGTASNDFNAFMRVARQSGGKTLFADPVAVAEPVAPKPACLSGIRDTATGSHLSWKIPDNGGSDITGYVILRSTTPGGETVLVANTGSNRNTYDDASAANNVPVYYYTIQAINRNGTVIGSMSNEINLVATAPPVIENACLLNGLTILTDKAGDSLDMVDGQDVRSLQIGEPFANSPNKVVFTLKMTSLATVPPSTRWPIVFVAPNGTNYTVRMTNSPSDGATTAPIFQVGPTAGTLVAADPASNFNADGTIKIIVPLSAIGNPAVGTQLTNFLVRIAANAGAATLTPDNMPDSLAPTGSYTLVGNASCGVQVPVGLESDVFNTATAVLHTTDGSVDSTDVAQTRRFQTGFDLPYAAGEFQRADSAPIATFGDGFIDALDVAQARRYQAGLDPLQPVAGPTAPSSFAATSSAESASLSADNNSTRKGALTKSDVIRVVSQKATPGETVTIALETDAKGGESIYGFTLDYDSSLLTYIPNSTAVGADAAGAGVLTNAETPGQLGFSVDFAGQAMAAGRGRQLLTMQFKVAEGKRGGSAALTFGDGLAKRSVASNPMTGAVRSMATAFVNGTVEIAAFKPRVSGRVASVLNRSVAGAEVRLTDSQGRQVTTKTNAFGYYRFENLVEGQTYSIKTIHPRLRFAARTVIINGTDEEANVTAAP